MHPGPRSRRMAETIHDIAQRTPSEVVPLFAAPMLNVSG